MVDYAAPRLNMVDCQLRTNKVSRPGVLEAFEAVPRELFVPESMRGFAYVDEDIQISEGRWLMEPMVLARLLQAAEPEAGDVALDIGCGSGYATAILARLIATVVALESDSEMTGNANRLLSQLSIDNAVAVEGPLVEGYAKQAPYNLILLSGAVAAIPRSITDQLADDGRLIAVVKDQPGMGQATLMRRSGAVIARRTLFDAATPMLPDFAREPGFVF
jgi:protein-L-isoaspartate(D-aspartate) O-methyltransferase